VLRVEQVCPEEIHEDVGIGVDVIVTVAADVMAFFDDEGGLAEVCGVLFGDDTAGESCSYYAIVVFFGEGIVIVIVDDAALLMSALFLLLRSSRSGIHYFSYGT